MSAKKNLHRFFLVGLFVFWCSTINVDLNWKWLLWTSMGAHRNSKAPTKGKEPGCSVFLWVNFDK